MDWLQTITTALAERTGTDAGTITLNAAEKKQILDVARVASHASGERINAPLLCYVLGMMAARGVELDDAAAIVRDVAGPVG